MTNLRSVADQTESEMAVQFKQADDLWSNLMDWSHGILPSIKGGGAVPLPDLVTEASLDLRSSIFTALHGLNKLAFTSLRNSLESILLALYLDGHEQLYQQYRKYGENQNGYRTPGFRDIMDWIFKKPLFRHFNESVPLRRKIETLYDDLSAFVHSRSLENQASYLEGSHPFIAAHYPQFKVYNAKVLSHWLTKVSCLVGLADNLLVLRYPPVVTGSNELLQIVRQTAERVRQRLPEEVLKWVLENYPNRVLSNQTER